MTHGKEVAYNGVTGSDTDEAVALSTLLRSISVTKGPEKLSDRQNPVRNESDSGAIVPTTSVASSLDGPTLGSNLSSWNL